MGIRNQQKISSLGIVPGIRLALNPFAQQVGSARILRNFVPERGRLARKSFSPNFITSSSSSSVWHTKNFRYTRGNAPNNEILVFKSDGKVYKRVPSQEQEIFPGVTSFSVLNQKPFVGQLGNRLFWHDGSNGFVYDGRDVQRWGIARESSAPSTSATGTGLTMSTGLKAAITWVVLDEAGNRVHESSRSDVAAFQVLSNENLQIDKSGLTDDPRATHWSGYVSELDGSEILRRTNTTIIQTDTFIVTALPAALDVKAPIRNDSPPKSTVGEVTKNRIFLRDDQSPEQFWFSALGEVKGLNNGAPDESFPGKDSSSISDLSNNDFIPDREISTIKSHNNIIFLLSERRGFGLTGELSLLDDRAPRDMTKLEVFTEGCAGADAIESTPFGLAWFTPGRKLWLWAGGQELLDIGEPIQTLLGTIPASSLKDVYMKWWEGNGRQWLVIALNSRDGESPDDSTTLAQRTLIYDFSIPSPRPDRAQPDPGSWIEWTDIAATCIGTYIANDGQEFLLIGDSSGNVKQADTIVSPCHLNRSMILGECYLGSTVQNNPQADMRTSLLLPSSDQWSVGHYLQLLTGDQNDPGVPSAGTFTEPTISSWIDPTSVDSPGTAITLTLDSALTSGDKRAWLQPDTTNTSKAGAFAKQFLFQTQYSAGVDDTGNADNRETNRINTIYKMGFTWSPKPEMAA